MRVTIVGVPLAKIALLACVSALVATPAWPQVAPQPPERHEHPATSAQEPAEPDMQMMREGSGTAWLPDTTPMYSIHWQRDPWRLMAHGNAFVQFLHESGDRGDDQFGSINWVMGMAQRNLGNGRLMFRGMVSVEPWTIRGCGYPVLLASGEQCEGEQIHDRQHPHDLVMEIAVAYDAPLKGPIRWQVYGGPAGEPALGPVAYPHRISAMPNPIAPIAHHWLDSTHITFGVLTAGVFSKRWKAEASVFNGREPDEERADFDLAALDSVSGRVWFLPTSHLALQVSAGKLTEAEASEGAGPRTDVSRITASATYHRPLTEDGIWATTVAWGRNEESGHGTNAILAETNLTLRDRDTWFGRVETVMKTAHDLAVDDSLDDSLVAKLQGGYTRYLMTWKGLKPGVGASLSAGFVPERLRAAYGSRVNIGFGIFVTIRPAAMAMHAGGGGGSGVMDHSQYPAAPATDHAEHPTTAPVDHSQHAMPQSKPSPPAAGGTAVPAEAAAAEPRLPVIDAERVIDPACATIDLVNAPKATYQRRVYYFCSAADRDQFVKDPAAYLKKRGRVTS